MCLPDLTRSDGTQKHLCVVGLAHGLLLVGLRSASTGRGEGNICHQEPESPQMALLKQRIRLKGFKMCELFTFSLNLTHPSLAHHSKFNFIYLCVCTQSFFWSSSKAHDLMFTLVSRQTGTLKASPLL